MSNANVNYEYFNNDNKKDKEHVDVVSFDGTSQYKKLYSNTNNADTSSQQHFVKDLTKPFTYHSISNETYHNLNHSHSHDESDCDYYPDNKSSIEDDGCFKLYFCGLIGCCLLCLFGCKHF